MICDIKKLHEDREDRIHSMPSGFMGRVRLWLCEKRGAHDFAGSTGPPRYWKPHFLVQPRPQHVLPSRLPKSLCSPMTGLALTWKSTRHGFC